MKGSPVAPNRLYASQSSGWFGQVVQRSDDGGATWAAVGNKFAYEGAPGTHQWYDGTPHPWEFKRVWHLEPSLNDPDTVYAGVEDAALFRSTDGGQTWQELAGLRGHGSGPRWQPGAGGMGLHTILLDPVNPGRIFIAISAAGVFRSDDAGATWSLVSKDTLADQRPQTILGELVRQIERYRRRFENDCAVIRDGRHLAVRMRIRRIERSSLASSGRYAADLVGGFQLFQQEYESRGACFRTVE